MTETRIHQEISEKIRCRVPVNLIIFATYKSTSSKRKRVNLCCRKQQSLLRILLHLTVMEHGCMGKNQRLLIASIIRQELIFCL